MSVTVKCNPCYGATCTVPSCFFYWEREDEMSLFQCEVCGAVENTACSLQGCQYFIENFDWSGMEERKGKKLCSCCAPDKFTDGTLTDLGAWHGQFKRKLLPMGMFKTNGEGNLAHVKTGDTDYSKYIIKSDAKTTTNSQVKIVSSPRELRRQGGKL